MTPFLATWLAVVLTAAAPSDTTVRTLTLHEAIALAEANAPGVIHALGQQRATAADVRAAYGAFLPSISVSAGANRQLPVQSGQTLVQNGQVLTLSHEPWSYSDGVVANIGLFSGGSRLFALRQAHALAAAATVDVTEQRLLAELAVKQQYFDVLASLESEVAADAQLELADRQLDLSILKLKARTVTRSDSLRSEILVQNGRLAAITARTALLQANASLTRLVGTDYPVTAAAGDSVDRSDFTPDEAALREQSLDGPLVHAAESQLTAARAEVRLQWAGYLPALTAGYSRTGNGSSGGFSPTGEDMAYSGQLRLAISMPIFDQFQRASLTTAAHAALDDAAATLRDTRLAALESLAQSLGAYRSATERAALQAATVEAAQEDLREHQEQYKVGTSTMVDVLTSEAALVQARHDLIQARYDRRIARAQLEALIGRSL